MNDPAARCTIHSRNLSRSVLFAALAILLICLTPKLYAIQHDPGDRDSGGGQPPVPAASADTLEPNDSPETAALLSWGGESGSEARSGPATIAGGLDLDFYAVELEYGDSLSAVMAVEEAGANTLSPAVSILDSNGTVIASSMLNPGAVSVTAPAAGRYLVLVTDRSLLDGSPFTGNPRGYELLLTRLLRRGDVDSSGELDYRDAFIVFMLAGGFLDPGTVDPQVLAAADLDNDGTVVGDMDDFRLLIDRIEYIPVRDPGEAGKQKRTGGATRLALADGSRVELGSGDELKVLIHGVLADSAASLWSAWGSRPHLPSAARATLEQNSPNPFNPSTTIAFSLPTLSSVELAVFSSGGRLVATLAAGEFPAGTHSVQWSGADSRGRPVASGVYFYRLRAGATVLTRKLVVLK